MSTRDRIGTVIDERYEITRLIGRGAMADVFRAIDHRAGREVAIKIIHQAAWSSPEALQRLQREAHVQELIRHDNVAALYGGGATDRDEPYLVVELLQGRSLRSVLHREGRIGLIRAANYCWQALRGLSAIHAIGVNHRDLKPANMMLSHGRLVLIDFGFASLDGGRRLTLQGHVVGSLSYMAPERLSSDTCDERADVYSMGVILYELLVGRPPFVSDDDFALIQAHLDSPPVPPSQAEPSCDITPHVEDILMRALDKQPERRLSASHMARDLERAVPAAARR